MSYIAGRVGLVPKGEWNATTQYQKLDIVTYNNKGYIAKVDNIPVGTLPTNEDYFFLSIDLDIGEIGQFAPADEVKVGYFGNKPVYRRYVSRTVVFDDDTYEAYVAYWPNVKQIINMNLSICIGSAHNNYFVGINNLINMPLENVNYYIVANVYNFNLDLMLGRNDLRETTANAYKKVEGYVDYIKE